VWRACGVGAWVFSGGDDDDGDGDIFGRAGAARRGEYEGFMSSEAAHAAVVTETQAAPRYVPPPLDPAARSVDTALVVTTRNIYIVRYALVRADRRDGLFLRILSTPRWRPSPLSESAPLDEAGKVREMVSVTCNAGQFARVIF
jgi:hypothetical protein